MTTFRVGMKVACVDTGPMLGNAPVSHLLSKGGVYTVRKYTVERGTPVVWLHEIHRNRSFRRWVMWGHFETPFFAQRFRNVVSVTRTAEHDAELFLPLLSPDPLDIATLYERDFADTEARLERLWTAMRSFEL